MKICLISNLFQLYEGWQKLYPDIIAEGLSKEHEVIVITARVFSGLSSLKPSVEDHDGIRVYRFYPLNLYHHYPYQHHPLWMRVIWHLVDIWNPHSYFVVKKVLKKEKPDIVHTMNLIGLSPSVFAAVRASGCPHLHTLTDGALISPWANLLRNGKMLSFNIFDRQYTKIKRFLAGPVQAVAPLSHFMLDMHRQKGYFKNCPAYIIEYPYRLYPPSVSSKSYSPFNILFVGNIVADKGIYVLLDVFQNLGRNGVNLHFAGRGPELENLREKAQGAANVHIHGFVSDEDLMKLYSQANVTVVPSLCFEAGKASAFLESLPFGTPVVASTAGGGHEGVVDGVNGRLFPPGDADALRDILRDLIDHREKLRQMESEALKSASDYRPEKCVADLVRIYEAVRHDS